MTEREKSILKAMDEANDGMPCPACDGTGMKPMTQKDCSACDGFGEVEKATPPAPTPALLELAGDYPMPAYHAEGMGCGLEDRDITDRYEAMQYGWDKAMQRVESETVAPLLAALATARPTAPAATAEAWVSVLERLPDTTIFSASHMVLALLWNSNQVVAYYDYSAGFWREHTEGTKLDITHWQPLPTPPTK